MFLIYKAQRWEKKWLQNDAWSHEGQRDKRR